MTPTPTKGKNIMIYDYMAQLDIERHERELTQRVERRRIAAERAAKQFDGSRLALVAHIVRTARASKPAAAQPTGC